MLEVAALSHFYGKHQALAEIALGIKQGEIVAILGANGAGKSTLLKSIAGLVRPAPGARITFEGQSIGELPPHLIVERGIALVPEGRGVFGDLTVAENLQLGAYPARARAGEANRLAKILQLFPRLAERMSLRARPSASFRSKPALKAPVLPVSTTTDVAASSSKLRAAAVSWRSASGESALMPSLRSNRTTAIRPSGPRPFSIFT